MKLTKTLVTAAIISTLSFSAFAAQEITREQVKKMNLSLVGTVDTNSTQDPLTAKHHLSEKADAKGGKYFVIIADDEGDKLHATAEVYK